MASLLSPGVISREIDLTTATPAVASTEGGIALDSQWGPVDKLVLVTDELDLVEFFGKPNSANAARWFTAKNFLSYSTALYVSRAVNSETYNATNHTSAENLQIKNSDSFEAMSLDGVSSLFAAKYAGSIGNTLKVSFADNSTYDDWDEKSSFSGKPDLDELHIAIIDEDGLFSGSKGTLLEKYEFVSKFSDAKNEDGSSNYYKQVVNDKSEYIYVLQHDPLMTGWGGNSSDYLDFDSTTGVATHKTDDNGDSQVDKIMLKFTPQPVSLQLVAPNTGTDANGNNFGDAGYTPTPRPWSADDFVVDQVINQSGVSGKVATWDEVTATLTIIQTSGGTWSDSSSTISQVVNENTTNTWDVLDGSIVDPVEIKTSYSLGHGTDGTVSSADLESAYDLFEDEELVDISFLIVGPDTLDSDHSSPLVQKVYDIVSSRQDCLGVLSPQKDDVVDEENPHTKIKQYRDKLNVGSLRDLKGSFMVMDDNWKYQFDKYNNNNVWVPCCGDTAGLMAETDVERAAWFSPGGRSLKNVIKLAWKSKKSERDSLYPLGINSITTFPGEGAILYGDRTMLVRPSAFDRINVRRLFIVLRKSISKTARSFLFENNTSYTRERFKSTVIPFLEEIQGRQGITDFKVVCDDTNNTGQVIDENRFIGDIYIKPTRSINFIELNFVAVRTDVEFSEIVGSI